MLPGSDASFAVAVVWLGVCVAAWLGARRWLGPWTLAHPALTVAAAASVARAVPALLLDRGLFFDVEAHWWIGTLVLAGRNVYTAPLALNRYPYPPLHGYVSALMVWLSGGDRMAFLIADKLIPAACGVALAVALWAAALRLGRAPGKALSIGVLYAVNPLPVLVTSYHGQFEEIPLLFIVLALLLLCGRGQTRGAAALSALLLGVAVAYKTWPLLFLPPLFLLARGAWRRLLYLPLTFVPLAVSIGLYGLAFGRAGMAAVVERLHDYKGSNGFCWGYVSALRHCWVQNQRVQPNAWVLPLNSALLLGALAIVLLLLLWRRRPLEGLVALPLAFYLFSPGWGPNYSVWVLPFALLLGVPLATRYTLLVLPVVALTYLDSLYAAYAYHSFSWAVLKPAEAALGLLGWGGVAVLLIRLYTARDRLTAVVENTITEGTARDHSTWGRRLPADPV